MDVKALLIARGLTDVPDTRKRMVEALAETKLYATSVLDAMATIPRHAFAPALVWRIAYADVELWAGEAFLPRPSVVARIASEVVNAKAEKVLEYASWTGYTTCILAAVRGTVDSVEHNPWLLWLAADAFRHLRLFNVTQKASDGRLGWPERAPYDAIVVGAALPAIPASLAGQLRDGGIVIAPLGPYAGPHRLTKVTCTEGGWAYEDLGPCLFPPLSFVCWGVDLGSWYASPGALAFASPDLQGARTGDAIEGRSLEGFASGAERLASIEGTGRAPGIEAADSAPPADDGDSRNASDTLRPSASPPAAG